VLGEVCSFGELIARVADFLSGTKVATVLLMVVCSTIVILEEQYYLLVSSSSSVDLISSMILSSLNNSLKCKGSCYRGGRRESGGVWSKSMR